MSETEPRRKRITKARMRYEKRKNRREAMVELRDESASKLKNVAPDNLQLPKSVQTAWTILTDTLWHLVYRTAALKIVGGLVLVIVGLFLLSLLFSSNIGPGVSSLGVALGGQSIEEAETSLLTAWNQETRITITLDGKNFASVRPRDIGLELDTFATAEAAKEAGLRGLFFGHSVEPIIAANYATAQQYLLNITDDVYIPPFEAHYSWDAAAQQVIGVAGTPSRELDIAATTLSITDDPLQLVRRGRLALVTTARQPQVVDPSPYLEEAQAFVTSGFTIAGYDPFKNEFEKWRTTPEEMTRWLVAGTTGLRVDTRNTERFVEGVNQILRRGDDPRYINEQDISESIQNALDNQIVEVEARIRYLQQEYTMSYGDTGFGIAFATGIPFRLINEANPNIKWEAMSPGDTIVLPSRDEVLPVEPVSHKRIVVDLDRRWMVAYENNEQVFAWRISVGRPDAPTSPGVFQILDKNEKASGGSFALCDTRGCDQWVMDYFMSIYEVAPGLTNGFHGAVLLPNGAYLNGGSAQTASTYGCVMADNAEAQQLYEWADVGTMVELISYRSGFTPESTLAQQAMEYIDIQTGTSAMLYGVFPA